MVTVGVNDIGIITIAGKSATQRKHDPEEIVIEEIVGIRINGIEEVEDLVRQLLYAIRKEAYEKGISDAYHNMMKTQE